MGKSFAYLVPASIRAAEHGEQVVIATNTIALQEQLIEKHPAADVDPVSGQGGRGQAPLCGRCW